MLRKTSSDVVGNSFRVDVAERLETQDRTNRGLMYRFFGEIAEPPDGSESIPAEREMLWARLRVTPRETIRRFKLAARIRPRRSLTGPPLQPELPELAAAVEEGAVGEDHIRAVCHAIDVLPACVSPSDAAEAERTLVRHATKLDAGVVTKLGQRIADYLNPDGLFTDTDRARRRGLRLSPQGPDGMSRLSGFLDPEASGYFEAIEAAVRPGRHQPADADADPGARDERTPAQRCHDALKLGLETAIASGKLGRAPRPSGDRGRHHHAGRTQPGGARRRRRFGPDACAGHHGRRFAAAHGDLIRMAATAIHYLAVFDDHTGRPLYLGRQKRVATADQRLICYARDRGCTRPNCLESGYRSEVHHSPDWARGGRTDADTLFFACGCDHGAASRGEWRTEVTDSGRLGWTKGGSPPEINHAHHPDELLRGDPDPPEADVD